MPRFIYVLAASAVVATGAFSAAQAKQIVPLHSQDVQKTVTAAFRSVEISGDGSNIALRPGRTTVVQAHEEWNLHQPTLAIGVSRGVLHVTINCSEAQDVGGVVTVQGALDVANDCTDDLAVTLPASVPVHATTGFGGITASGFRRGLQLTTDSGNVAARNVSGPQVQLSSGNGSVVGSGINAAAVSLSSDSGDVNATGVRASSLGLKSANGAVSASSVTATVLTATSDSGDVGVADAAIRAQALLHSDNGAVSVSRVKAGSLDATSSAGDIKVTDSTFRTAKVSSDNGSVTASHLGAQSASLHSDSGDVAADLTNQPQTLTATSSNGAINLDVPTGRYDVQADSDNGTVHVTGLIIDTSVRPFIRAHSDSGNVTVQGD
ncbi:MAG TPA: DUF4097 family beta strand repeat-containing protein [Mycobacteriales bacterium]|nr:DUF4097 family beta strand repeat-containing protein [Mycobacteriales bacterium]